MCVCFLLMIKFIKSLVQYEHLIVQSSQQTTGKQYDFIHSYSAKCKKTKHFLHFFTPTSIKSPLCIKSSWWLKEAFSRILVIQAHKAGCSKCRIQCFWNLTKNWSNSWFLKWLIDSAVLWGAKSSMWGFRRVSVSIFYTQPVFD